jgi:Replication initiator protein, pSAM2
VRWGAQVDTRTITDTADEDTGRLRVAHDRQVAAYLAKYLTKATEDFGLPQRVMSAAHAASTGASVHAVRLIETAEYLAEHGGEPYTRLLAHLASLGLPRPPHHQVPGRWGDYGCGQRLRSRRSIAISQMIFLLVRGWPGPGSNRRPSAFQAPAESRLMLRAAYSSTVL